MNLILGSSGHSAGMVFEVVCGACGTILYSGIEIRSPKDVLKMGQNNGKCRGCGKGLSTSDFSIEVVRPANL